MLLGDVMLVLPDSDRLRIDLHQLRQRVLHAAGNGCGAALGHIQIRELLLRKLGGGIDTGSRFINDQVRQLRIADLCDDLGGELLRLPRAGAVADYDQLNAVFGNQLLELRRRLLLLLFGGVG